MQCDKNYVTIQEAASVLSVSDATVRNWMKQGLLESSGRRGLTLSDVHDLRERIGRGEVDRLNRRANRRSSRRSYVPVECLENRASLPQFETLALDFEQRTVSPERAVSMTALRIFSERGDLRPGRSGRYARKGVEALFEPVVHGLAIPEWLMELPLPEERDLLGHLYQRLRPEGDRSRQGAFFTPYKLALQMVPEPAGPESTLWDPCCGTGIFLRAALEKGWSPENIRGTDRDPVAVFIARANLLLYHDSDFTPLVQCRDSLLSDPEETFDCIVSNPPWGAGLERGYRSFLNERFEGIISGESSSYFLAQGLKHLKQGGLLSYLLPEALLTVRSHRDIRRIILNKSRPVSCRFLGRPFHRVFSEVVALSLKKGPESGKCELEYSGRSHSIETARIVKDRDFRILLRTTERDWRLLEKVEKRPHWRLEQREDICWGMGIVTGNNGLHCLKRAEKGSQPLLRGKDISPFYLSEPKMFINFNKSLYQQSAPDCLYRSPQKIVYRFISSYPVAALDSEGQYLLNSANFLVIPGEASTMAIVILLWNSPLFRYYWRMKFPGVKILKGDLARLPLPVLTSREKSLLMDLYRERCGNRIGEEECHQAICGLYGLTPPERKRVEETIQRGI